MQEICGRLRATYKKYKGGVYSQKFFICFLYGYKKTIENISNGLD